MALVMPLAGKLTERYGGGPVALAGVLVTTVMTVPFGLIGAHTSVAFLSVCDGAARRRPGLQLHAGDDRRLRDARTPASCRHATPQLNVLNRVGGSIGTAILAVVLATRLTRRAHRQRRGAAPTAPPSGGRRARRAGDHPLRGPDARRAQRATARHGQRRGEPGPGRAGVRRRRGGAGVSAVPRTRPARRPIRPAAGDDHRAERLARPARRRRTASWAWRSSGRWSRCAGCAGARPIARSRSATPNTGCCSAWRGCASAPPAISPSTPT